MELEEIAGDKRSRKKNSQKIPAVIAFVSITALLIIRGITFKVLHRWAEKTETDIDDIVITAFKTPSFYWCVAIGLHIGIAISGLPERYISYISKTIHVVVSLLRQRLQTSRGRYSPRMFRDQTSPSRRQVLCTGY